MWYSSAEIQLLCCLTYQPMKWDEQWRYPKTKSNFRPLSPFDSSEFP